MESRWSRKAVARRAFGSLLAAAFLAGLVVAGAPPVAAEPVTVTVTVLRVVEVSCDEGTFVPCPDDYFARVRIGPDGYEESASIDNPDVADIAPHWTFSEVADTDDGTIPVEIQIWDHDDSSENDLLDASPFGNTIDVALNLTTGTWTGDTATNVGFAEGGNVRVFFDITVGGTADIDGDGIPDGVERFGIRDAAGNLLVDMQALGADPCRKSIAVEIDFMNGAPDGHTHRPRAGAVTEAVTMFNNAPVPAVTDCPYAGFPRSPTGVDFLVVVDDAIAEAPVLGLGPDFDATRDDNFDRSLRPYFHYVLFVHDRATGNSSSGVCCSDGKDAIVSLGSWSGQRGTVRDQSGTLVHELGHAWGFGHGGGDGDNCKPNYLSVMSYSFQVLGVPDPTLPAVDVDGDGFPDVGLRLDFSRSALPSLNEDGGLDETVGIQAGTAGTFFADSTGADTWDFNGGAIDWNGDGDASDTGVTADVNAVAISGCGNDGGTPPSPTPSPDETLAGFNDWANLKYRAALSPDAGFAPGVVEETFDAEDAATLRAGLIEALRPDLTVDLTAGPDPVVSGSPVTWSVSTVNNGQGPARDVTVAVDLPPGVSLDSCTASGDGACSDTAGGATIGWDVIGPGETVTIEVVTTAACAAPDLSTLTASATASTSSNEKEPADNSDDAAVVVSNPAPVVEGLDATPDVLWPPNHKLRTVSLDYSVVDNCGSTTVDLEVDSNEPVNGLGDGDTAPDWVIGDDPFVVELRAERSEQGDGRIYTITITVEDEAGNVSSDSVDVLVPSAIGGSG